MEDSSNYSIASEIGYIGDESSREDGASPFNQNAIPEDGHSGGHGVGDASVDLDAHNEHADHNDFDESYMDFVEAEDQKEALDEFCKIMGMTFGSEVEAYMFYNSYAKKHGFSIRKEKVKRAKGTRKIRFRRFVCSRSGKRQEKLLTMNGRTWRLRAETRCNCHAQLTVKLDRSRGVWFVGKFVDDHCHVLARPDEVPFLWSHRRIKDFQRAEILAMGAAGIRKHVIMDGFISRYGEYGKVGFVRRDIYNLCCRNKRLLIAKGDASTAIGIMASRKEKDPDFFFEYQVDTEGRLKCMFWCDAQSRLDYQDYGGVVVFDSTYKKNKYGMPFVPFVGLNNHRSTTVFGCGIASDETEQTYVWLLGTFMRAMCQQKPRSVITDGDAAMIKAIQTVFPDVKHRICSWHIEKNMQKHLHFKCLKEFRSLIYYTTSHASFEESWNTFIAKYQTDKTRDWLSRMYKKRRLWAAAFLSDGYFLGMRSNQRSESFNSCLHLHLDYGMTLVDLIVHYENCIVRIRETEARDDCTASQSLPVAITDCKEIEVAASHVFTPANFYLLQEDLKKVGDLEVFDTLVGLDSQRFIVAWKNNRKYSFFVDYAPANTEETIKCSCRRMDRVGLPCKHILHVLNHLGISEIPKCCVLRRFSKKARGGLPARRRSDLYGWGWTGAVERSRYSELTVLGAEAFHVAASDPFLFDKMKEYLQDIISNKHEYGNRETGQNNSISEGAETSEGTTVVVGDPIRVSTKGAPKQNTKAPPQKNPAGPPNGRAKAFNEKSKQHLCSLCSNPGHNARTCPTVPPTVKPIIKRKK